jgi:cell wall-associated NlpC family hydrolase
MNKKVFLIILFILLAFLSEKANSQSTFTAEQKKTVQIDSEIRDHLVAYAKGFLGIPYRYASANPETGFDCSGFVNFVFGKFGINVPHSSKAFKNLGILLKPEDFKVGNVLVFYGYRNATQIGHVGIICEAAGMNSKFIHASSGKIKKVIISELNSDLYKRRFFQCVDVISGK